MRSDESFKEDVILTDICSKLNKKVDYVNVKDETAAVGIQTTKIASWRFSQRFTAVLKDIFLPKGYPDSVSCDYLEYQIWDTCQAFCSSISGTLTMRAIMQGIGVGSETATPVSAAMTWMLKDGTGMIGSIIFAWLKGSKLDSDCKKWRLFADILNDVAMFIELYIPMMPDYSLYMLCSATAFKALVGTAGSSTRAALITHQAVKGNIADVSAKDGSQEIFTNLCAFVFGIFVLKNVTETNQVWTLMCTATLFHIIFNYKAVRCLNMNVFNGERFRLCLRTYLPTSCLPTVKQVNKRESVFLFMGTSDVTLSGFSIKFGVSIKDAVRRQVFTTLQLSTLVDLFQNKNYFIISDNKRQKMYVTFRQSFKEDDVLKAYFHAYLLAIAIADLQKNINLKIISRSRKDSPVYRLTNLLKEYVTLDSISISEEHRNTMILQAYMCCEDFIEKEYGAFSKACGEEGWATNKHLVNIDDWRSIWKYREVKKELMKMNKGQEGVGGARGLSHQVKAEKNPTIPGKTGSPAGPSQLKPKVEPDLSNLLIS